RTLIQKDLGGGLGFHNDPSYFSIFRDNATGLEYIRNSGELCQNGLYVELGAYKYHVFIDFREVRDNSWRHYAQVAERLSGAGVPSVEGALKDMLLEPLQQAFKGLVNADTFRRLLEARIKQPQAPLDQTLMEEIEKRMLRFLQEAKRFGGGEEDETTIAREVRRKVEAILYFPILTSRYPRLRPKGIQAAAEYLHQKLTDSTVLWATLFGWLFVHVLGKVVRQGDFAGKSRTWIDEWRLDKSLLEVLQGLGLDDAAARNSLAIIKWLTGHQRWFEGKSLDPKAPQTILERLLKDREIRQFLQINLYKEVWWFNKEAFEEMLWWLMMVAALTIGSDPLRPVRTVIEELEGCYATIQKWQQAEENSEYQVEKLLEGLAE
ncbi:MAG TPA: hypothetical protein VLZ03_11090, partial [Thermodesulfobacteriota bacterium]|nr:hypothetical protein [Thermodesulfobacteriota bacterium]